MKKKNILLFALVAILAFALGIGTLAYYSKGFTSEDNILRAAKFTVDSNGTLDGKDKFSLVGRDLYPGVKEDNLYEFEIDRKDTEVPVEYEITVLPEGEIFESIDKQKHSPIEISLYRKVEDKWEKLDKTKNIKLIPNYDVENFKLGLNWGHSDYDVEYQNTTGKIDINVVATQMDKEIEVPKPSIKIRTYPGLGSRGINIEVEGVDGADQFELDYTPIRFPTVNLTTEISKIGAGEKGSPKILKGAYIITNVRIYDVEGNLIYTFQDLDEQIDI